MSEIREGGSYPFLLRPPASAGRHEFANEFVPVFFNGHTGSTLRRAVAVLVCCWVADAAMYARFSITRAGSHWTATSRHRPPAAGGSGAAVPLPAAAPIGPVWSVPQYLMGDAAIFIQSGIAAAGVLSREADVSVQAPEFIASQARFLMACTRRSLADIRSLRNNANATRPEAIPALKKTIAELIAAEAQVRQNLAVAAAGRLGPTYRVTAQSALAHLKAAEVALGEAEHAYPMGLITPTSP